MGGFGFERPSTVENPTAKQSPPEPSAKTCTTFDLLKSRSFIYVMKHFPRIIPDISEESITDRAESSSLSKAVLVVKVGRFCINCAARHIHGLPLSLLEVSTAAHALCTLLAYFAWWSKPLNIAEGTKMEGSEAENVHALLACSDEEYSEALILAPKMGEDDSQMFTEYSKRINLAARALKHLLPTPEKPPSDSFRERGLFLAPGSMTIKSTTHPYYEFTTTAISTTIYGLVHLLAWGDRFPTPLEGLFWRVSSAVITCLGPVGVILSLIGSYLHRLQVNSEMTILVALEILVTLIGFVIPLVHVLASGFLVVESIRQVFCLDAAVYRLPSSIL
jgi:hypothetical protein